MMFGFGESITVLSPVQSGTDHGRPVVTYAETAQRRVGVAPVIASDLSEDNRAGTLQEFDLYDDMNSPIDFDDRIIVRGEMFDVVSHPQRWQSPYTGWQAGAVIRVRRVEG